MTAPLRTGDPTIVNVALGARSYDIVIGRGLLASLGARIAALRPRRQGCHRHRRECRSAASARRRGCTGAGRRRRRAVSSFRPGEASKSYRVLERGVRGDHRRAHRARRSRRRARRRRHRRSRRLCRRGGAPRHRLCAGADDAAGAGRFLGRRQDRDRFRATARIWSARSISRSWWSPTPRCSTRCRRANSAPATPRSRNTACSATRHSSAWLEANWRDVFAGGKLPELRASTPSRYAAASRPRSWRATSARPATAHCSISATPSATRSKPRAAFPTGCCMARRLPSAWRWHSHFRRGRG